IPLGQIRVLADILSGVFPPVVLPVTGRQEPEGSLPVSRDLETKRPRRVRYQGQPIMHLVVRRSEGRESGLGSIASDHVGGPLVEVTRPPTIGPQPRQPLQDQS